MTKERLKIIMGENIRRERIALGMSIDELAQLLALTPGFLGLIERGERGVTPYNLFKLADIFGLPTDKFFYRIQSDSSTEVEGRRRKIYCLTTGFREKELNFVIQVIKGVRRMNHHPSVSDDEFDTDTDYENM